MESINIEAAVRRYEKQKEIARKYYQDNKADILQKKKETYREKHPNPNPRGRPRKVLMELDPRGEGVCSTF